MTYSKVKETRADGAASIFEYSNHHWAPGRDTEPMRFTTCDSLFSVIPFNSHELFRGLLLKRTDLSTAGDPVRIEVNNYHIDTTTFMKALSRDSACGERVRSYSYRKILTGHPYLEKKTIVLYDDDGNGSKESTEYTYDSHRRLTGITRKVGGVRERDSLTYTGNYTTHPYSGMVSRNMISYTVEHIRFRKDTLQAEKVISAELITWKESDTTYVPAAEYRAALGTGVALDKTGVNGFKPFAPNSMDVRYGLTPELSFQHDTTGNIVLSEDRSGLSTTYVWTKDGCHPAAIIPGAKRGYTSFSSNDITRVKTYHLDPDGPVSLDFESLSPFTMRIWLMCPNYQCWDLSPVVDGIAHRIVCVNDPQAPNPWPAHANSYPSPLEIPLSAGTHTLRIPVSNHFYVANSPDPNGYTVEINHKEKQVTTVNVPGQTVVFEDFEADGNVTSNGYCSGRSHQGTWTHSLDTSGGPYVVDYRVFKNGKWNYVRQSASGSTVSIDEGTAPIDHVRVYPLGSMPESYTWNDDGTLRSKTDSRGVTESYEYDPLGRLMYVLDNDGYYVEHYEYNYQNK